MSAKDEDMEKAFATPLGRAFKRLLEDEEFASKVIESPDDVATEYGLDADDMEALVGDAHSLEGEVSGFSFGKVGSFGNPLDLSGGLLTPGRLGMPRRGWTGCLTMT